MTTMPAALSSAMASSGLFVPSSSTITKPTNGGSRNPGVPCASLSSSGETGKSIKTGSSSSEKQKKKPKRCMTAYNFFFQDQRQAILMEMESKAALAAAKENAEALARARQEYDDEKEDGDLKDAIVVDLEDSECSTDSIGNSNKNNNKKRHHHRMRRRSESNHTGSSEVIDIIEPVQPKKISFRELGAEIGRRWKALQEQGESSQKLTRYRELADADAARYQTEMDEYHRERVSAMCRGGNLGHRYNEARETVEAQQALQAQEAVAAMKAAMGQEKNNNDNHRASAPPQGQPQGQAQAQDPTFSGGMMPMMMMMPNPLNPTQMMPCMLMMAAPAGMAMPMPMPMGMPMSTTMPGMPGGMMMMPPTAATPGTTQKQVQDQAKPSAPVQNQPEAQPAIVMQESLPRPPQQQKTQTQRKGFFPSIGPSLEILEDFDEFPTVEDPPLPNNNGLVLPTDMDANQLPLFQQSPRKQQEPANKKSKMDRQDDLLDISFDDAALMAISKDNDAFNKLLHSIMADAAATKKANNLPIKTVTVHKHHSHHKHRHHKHRNVDHHPKSDKKKRSRRASNTSVDTISLMKDIAKAFGEDWDPTPVKVPKNISFQTKVLEHSAKASTLAAAAGQSKTNCRANATVYQNFDQMMDSLETYNYESDVSGFHDLFDGTDKDAKDNHNKPFFPTFDPTKQDGNVFDSTKRSDANANANANASASEAAGAQPFFPCIDTKTAVESGFLNNNVTTDIATLNKKALFHGRSTGNTNCSLDSADRAAGATSTSCKPTANEVVDLTTDNVIENLQELLQRQQAILGMRI